MGRQLFFLSVSISLFVVTACTVPNRNLSKLLHETKHAKRYFFNTNTQDYKFICRDDSLSSVLDYSSLDNSVSRRVESEVHRVAGTEVDLYEKMPKYVADLTDSLSNLLPGWTEIDSVTFWTPLSKFLDTTTFELQTDWKLLDQTFQQTEGKPLRIPVDRLKVNSRKYTRMNTPMLFFMVSIARDGSVEDVLYNSWYGAEKVNDLIHDVQLELQRRKVSPFTFYGIPVKVKLRVNVTIVDSIT